MKTEAENKFFSDSIIDSCQGIEIPPYSYCSNFQTPFSEITMIKEKKPNKYSMTLVRDQKKQKPLDLTKEKDFTSFEERCPNEHKIKSQNKFVNTIGFKLLNNISF